jgi:hypothetical protein
LKAEGSFAGLANLVPYTEVNGLFSGERLGHPVAAPAGKPSAK